MDLLGLLGVRGEEDKLGHFGHVDSLEIFEILHHELASIDHSDLACELALTICCCGCCPHNTIIAAVTASVTAVTAYLLSRMLPSAPGSTL